MVRCSTCNMLHNDKLLQIFLLFSMIWYCRVQSLDVSERHDVRWCSLRWSILLSLDHVWEWIIDKIISTRSCSYCIWKRYCQNHRSILPKFLFLLYDYILLNSIDFRVQSKRCARIKFSLIDSVIDWLCWNRVLIGLSRLLHTHIAYETDTVKMIAAFYRISYCLHDLIRLNSIVCRGQTTRYTTI